MILISNSKVFLQLTPLPSSFKSKLFSDKTSAL